MEVAYKRDISHSYLILKEDKEQDTSSYQIRMLMGNGIPSLLPCTMQGMNGDVFFCYDITSRQSLHVLYEKQKLGKETLKLLLEGVVLAMEQIREYLLDPDDLVLASEYLYLENGEQGVGLCYLPGYQKSIQEQFRSFSEYLLPKIDHNDIQAVTLGYGIYRIAMEGELQLGKLKEEMYHPKEQPFKEETVPEPAKETSVLEEFREQKVREAAHREAMEAFFQEEPKEEEKDWRRLALPVLGGTGVAGAVGYLVWTGYLSWMIAAIFGFAVAAGGGLFYVFRYMRQRKEEKDKKEDNEELLIRQKQEQWEVYREVYQEEQALEEAADEKNGGLESKETTILFQSQDLERSSLVSKIPGKFPTIFLEKKMVVIGKLPEASDAVIEVPTISRIHARICEKEGEFYLTDLNSRNGTCVNGKILQGEEEYLLKDHDEVSFAQIQYIFIK